MRGLVENVCQSSAKPGPRARSLNLQESPAIGQFPFDLPQPPRVWSIRTLTPIPTRHRPPITSAALPKNGPIHLPAKVPTSAMMKVAAPIATAVIRISTCIKCEGDANGHCIQAGRECGERQQHKGMLRFCRVRRTPANVTASQISQVILQDVASGEVMRRMRVGPPGVSQRDLLSASAVMGSRLAVSGAASDAKTFGRIAVGTSRRKRAASCFTTMPTRRSYVISACGSV
jgi:hypothetical protein